MKPITPTLWFDTEAEAAAELYVSVFATRPGPAAGPSRLLSTDRYGEEAAAVSGRPAGSVMTVNFELDGNEFVALNGGPMFRFTPAVSFMIRCDGQAEVDHFWARLTDGGRPSQCGWLEDRYGLSWQVVPTALMRLLHDEDPARAKRAMSAMLQMQKIDVAALEKAAAGK